MRFILGGGKNDTDVLHATQQALRGHIGQGRIDKGRGAQPAPDKEKMHYTLAQGRARGFSRNQHA